LRLVAAESMRLSELDEEVVESLARDGLLVVRAGTVSLPA